MKFANATNLNRKIRRRDLLFAFMEKRNLEAICPIADLFLTNAVRISRSEKLIWTRLCCFTFGHSECPVGGSPPGSVSPLTQTPDPSATLPRISC